MKFVSLNTYQGIVFDPLMRFVEELRSDTDVFCFQEVMSALEPREVLTTENGARVNLLQELEKRLPDFEMRSAPMQDDFETIPTTHGPTWFGIATFVRKTIPIRESGETFLCHGRNTFVDGDYGTLGFPCLFVRLELNGAWLTVCNVHGNSEPPHKRDTPLRLAQSRKILELARRTPGKIIIAGDFNLMPETESLRLFEQSGLRNLIKEHRIHTTRGTHCWTLHPQYTKPPYEQQEFADYTFVSPGIVVNSFSVPDLPISDHLPMVLDCELGSAEPV